MRTVGFVLGVVVLLALALVPAVAAQPFSDVPQDHWAYNAIDKLATQGLIEGYPDGTFKGKRTMTRYEFAVALARLMDRVDAMGIGKQGEKGEKGEKGEAGVGGGQGLTEEQKALLNRLATEFAPELQALRSDLNALTSRVEALEKLANITPGGPTVTVGGDIGWRAGVYGTKLGFENTKTTGYPFFENGQFARFGGGTAFGTINGIPISDSLKDSFKAGDFMEMRTRVHFAANLAPNTSAFVQLLAGPTTNLEFPQAISFESTPTIFTGNGLMDTVQLDQIWLKHATRFIAPVDLTVGKQYLRRGVGLLFDNDQEAVKALRADFGTGRVRVGTFLGMLDPEQFLGRTASAPPGVDLNGNPLETNGQDNINLVYADLALFRDWSLGANWLDSGFNKEQGWSASLTGPILGVNLYGEYSRLTKWTNGEDFADLNDNGVKELGETPLDDSDTAWLAGLKWSNTWMGLTGEYGQVDAGYALSVPLDGWDAAIGPGFFNLPLSALHPRAEIDPYDINWIDRPLFLDPTNIAKGWHVQATFPTLLGAKTPLTVSYASGDAYNEAYLAWLFAGGTNGGGVAPGKWRDADPVWYVKLSRQMSDSVTASLLYGRREVDNVMSPQTVPVPGTTTAATNDPLQVIRAEVAVQF